MRLLEEGIVGGEGKVTILLVLVLSLTMATYKSHCKMGRNRSCVCYVGASGAKLMGITTGVDNGSTVGGTRSMVSRVGGPAGRVRCARTVPRRIGLLSYTLGNDVLRVSFDRRCCRIGSLSRGLVQTTVIRSLLRVSKVSTMSIHIRKRPLGSGRKGSINLVGRSSVISTAKSSLDSCRASALALCFTSRGKSGLIGRRISIRCDDGILGRGLVMRGLVRNPSRRKTCPAVGPTTGLLDMAAGSKVYCIGFSDAFLVDTCSMLPRVAVCSVISSLMRKTKMERMRVAVGNRSGTGCVRGISLSRPLGRRRS